MSSNFTMLFRLVTEANFLAVLIALFIIFFLLGMIIGSSFNCIKKDRKEDPCKKHLKSASDRTSTTDILGQNYEKGEKKTASEPKPPERDPRYRYYNWW